MTKTNDDPTETIPGSKPKKFTLTQRLEKILKENCTGMDDHDDVDCRKCKDM